MLLSCRFFFKMYIFIATFGTYLESITLVFELSEFSIVKSCSPFSFTRPSTYAIAWARILEHISISYCLISLADKNYLYEIKYFSPCLFF